MLFFLAACGPQTSPVGEVAETAGSWRGPDTFEGWLTTVPGDGVAGNLSITGAGDVVVVAVDYANADQSNDQLEIIEIVGSDISEPELLRVAQDAAKPSVAADEDDLFVLAIVDCATDACVPGDRQLALWHRSLLGGAWDIEQIDPEAHAAFDHGRSDLALQDGHLTIAYVLHQLDQAHDELWYTVRDYDGVYTEPLSLSDGRVGADDHPFVLAVADGPNRVGFAAARPSGRRAAVWFEETGATTYFDDGKTGRGEDLGLVQAPDGMLHAVWREASAGTWRLTHGACQTGCDTLENWSFEAWTPPMALEAPDVAMSEAGQLMTVFTANAQVRFGWPCPDGFHHERVGVGGGAESTERGQPSIWVDEGHGMVHVAYTKVRGDGDIDVRWAARPLPICR